MRTAHFRFELQNLSRNAGRSLVAAAAYRWGEPLYDERTGLHHLYPSRGRIDLTEIRAPEGAPGWVHDPERLTNSIQAHERRKDARLARDILINIPHELSFEQGMQAVRAFVDREFTRKGYVTLISSHGYRADPKTGRRNWHVHLLVSMRRLVNGQWWGLKDLSLDKFKALYAWRQSAADRLNEALRSAGINAEVHARSAKRRLAAASNPVHVPYGLWKRAERAAEKSRSASVEAAIARPAASPTSTMQSPANDVAIERRASIITSVGSAILRAGRHMLEAVRERSLAASAEADARLEAEEKRKREAQRATEQRLQAEAEWTQREAEQRARRERENLLVQLRDAMFDKAREGPELAFAKAWMAEAQRAVLLDGQTIETYGKAADRAGMRALVEAGGDRLDATAMAKLSPTTGLIADELARTSHIGRMMSFALSLPDMKSRDELAQREAAQHLRVDSPVIGRPRLRVVEMEPAPALPPIELERARSRALAR
jgi:type IV secretion system protein VirD4